MSKLTLETLASGFMDVDLLNRNFADIQSWADSVLSRTGQAPNQMQADLDMNGHDLLNLNTDPSSPDALVSRAAMEAYVNLSASGVVRQQVERQAGVAAQTLVTFTTLTYEAGANNLAVYVDGVRMFAPLDYTETSSASITLAVPLSGGEEVVAVTNEFLGTVVLPPHTHVWADIIGPPATATRWPTYAEVTDKPTTYPPATHTHSASAITIGRLADARRGVYVQSGAPADPVVGDLWFW